MAQSTSNLLNYISLLMHDDDALSKFIVDPITSERKHGVTKAERAVLRRTVAHLSNHAVNGFSMARSHSSYRRSLRLLQNVLHNVGSKMAADAYHHADAEVMERDIDITYSYALNINYPAIPNGETIDFTCKTNEFVNNNFKTPYANQVTYIYRTTEPQITIKYLMDQLVGSTTFEYESSENVVVSIALTYERIGMIADLTNECYDLDDPHNPNPDYVFWFYNVNGTRGDPASGKRGEGNEKSFTQFTIEPGDTAHWQLIAPDQDYGFGPCGKHPSNEYAVAGGEYERNRAVKK